MPGLVMLVLLFLLNLASSYINQDEFSFNGYLSVDGAAWLDPSGLLKLTDTSPRQGGTSSTKIQSNSRTPRAVVFPLFPLHSSLQSYLNTRVSGNSSNHIVAIELDTVQDFECGDIDDNHVGIDINSLQSVRSKSAGYFTDEGEFKSLDLKNGDRLQLWVEYNGVEKQLDVTLHPIDIPKPKTPLLSLKKDLSPYIFKINGKAKELDLSRLPKIPRLENTRGIKQLWRILALTLSLTGLTLVLVVVFGAVLISRKKRFIEILEDWEVQYGPHRFSYKDVFKATKGFKEKEVLGRGGFGRVYKGVLPSSNMQVAVKRISHDSRQGMREFVAEIATIGRLRHPNLVRLLGYCRRKHELLLVYDYMPKGSLDKFLYHLPNCNLSWTQRFKIIKDVASALFYLHQQWVQVIIHRDIKPANVLIDSDMNAKLGDFGLAKLCDLGNDPQTSHVAGTFGYMAPELARAGKASTSTDVYAFGVFLLEIACGRRPIEARAPPDEAFIADWIVDCWDKGDILATVDGRLEKNFVVQEAELVLKLGLFCSHPVAAARPSMSSVISYLDGVASLPDDLSSVIKAREFPGGSNDELITAENDSINSLTITESFVSHGR
ncbi:hypothetical protein GQ457_02G039200 [Hibiscus cannabinus]